MRYIDTHTHFPGHTFGGVPRDGAQLRRAFERAGLAGAWIMTTDGLVHDPHHHNDVLAEATKDHRDFFWPFCTVNPHTALDVSLREMERCVRQLKMRGLKLHPWLQAFSLTHPNVVPLLSQAGALGLPVLLHDGTPPYSTPLQIAWAAAQVPQTTIILGHAGLDDLWEDAVTACRRQPNIFLCLCAVSAGLQREIIRRCPVDKLVFGSDAGFMPDLIEDARAKLLASGAPRTVLNRIVFKNPWRLLPPETDLA